MANEVQIGDKFTNGRETITITEIKASGRVKFQYNWNDKPTKHWASLPKGYTKVAE